MNVNIFVGEESVSRESMLGAIRSLFDEDARCTEVVQSGNLSYFVMGEATEDMNNGIAELSSHLSQTKRNGEYVDQTCVTQSHVDEGIECYCAMDDCVVVDITSEVYQAESVKFTIYYVELAE